MNATTVHENLDRRGLLDDAQGSGTYAIEMAVPDSVEAAEREWRAHSDAIPGDDQLAQLAAAEATCYVGASKDVYARLMDHFEAEVRKASVFEAFEPRRVVGVWPEDDPFDAERSRAYRLAGYGWVCWIDGEVVG